MAPTRIYIEDTDTSADTKLFVQRDTLPQTISGLLNGEPHVIVNTAASAAVTPMGAADPGTIEGTPLSVVPYGDAAIDTLDDLVTWGSMDATVGSLLPPTRRMRLGTSGSWVAYVGTDPLVPADQWYFEEAWESTSGATRVDIAGPMTVIGTPASAPEVLDHADTALIAAASHVINLPTATAGQVYFGQICPDGHDVVSGLSGWTVHEDTTIGSGDSTGYRTIVVSKVASGSDTLTITMPGGESVDAKMLLLSAGALITKGTLALSSDPPALDLGTTAPTLWLATAAHDGVSANVGTGDPPTGYTFIGSVVQQISNSTAAACHIAQKTSTAQSDDPSAFTVMGPQPAVNTYAVRF